LCFKWRQKYGL